MSGLVLVSKRACFHPTPAYEVVREGIHALDVSLLLTLEVSVVVFFKEAVRDPRLVRLGTRIGCGDFIL